MRSLRIRLMLLLGVAILAAAALQFATSFRVALKQANRLLDYDIQQVAAELKNHGYDRADWSAIASAGQDDASLVIQIWTPDGGRVYPPSNDAVLPVRADPGYSNVTLANGEWRIYTLENTNSVIQVAQKMEVRKKKAVQFALHAVWPVLPVSLLLLGACWWLVTSALSPLRRIGKELGVREAQSVSPLSIENLPEEIVPLVLELNAHLLRAGEALQLQQHFLADATHELRSPLTALRFQVQMLARANAEEARMQAIERLLGGVDRATRLVEQMLSLARQNPLAREFIVTPTPLAACVSLAIAEVQTMAVARHISLQREPIPEVDIDGDADALIMLIRNLLDNAVRYTPDHGTVRISAVAKKLWVTLIVEDSGPGIPRHQRQRVFDRFFRVPGTEATGSGLGLAIVKTIAKNHMADVQLTESSLGGLAVKVVFPLDPDPQPVVEGIGSGPIAYSNQLP